MENVILNKIESIERCVKRIEEIYNEDKLDEYLFQDAIILNIQRACQQSIDLAMYICSNEKLGIPKKTNEAFSMIYEAGIIDKDIYEKMKKMVGFRNIVIHEYQKIELEVIKYIAEYGKNDFLQYTKQILKI